MTLDIHGETARLLGWGLVDQRAIVEGDFKLSSVARRNRNLRLDRRRGASYLIKQPEPGRGSRRTLRVEAGFYEFCRNEPRVAPVAELMARLHAFFEDERILILEIVEGGRPLWREMRAHDPAELPRRPAQACGAALATVHNTFRDPKLFADSRLAGLATAPPWVLDLPRPTPGIFRHLSPAKRRLLEIVQKETAVAEALAELAADWRLETVIHGDIRSGNVLVVDGEDGSAGVRLIDWEMVQRGDPAWDVAGVLQDVLLFWLRSMPQEPNLEPGSRVGEAAFPLPALQPLVAALWRGYLSAADLRPPAAAELLRRVVRFSGARLFQTAWEHSGRSKKLTSLAVLLTQIGANVLADAGEATVTLFGLPPAS